MKDNQIVAQVYESSYGMMILDEKTNALLAELELKALGDQRFKKNKQAKEQLEQIMSDLERIAEAKFSGMLPTHLEIQFAF